MDGCCRLCIIAPREKKPGQVEQVLHGKMRRVKHKQSGPGATNIAADHGLDVEESDHDMSLMIAMQGCLLPDQHPII